MPTFHIHTDEPKKCDIIWILYFAFLWLISIVSGVKHYILSAWNVLLCILHSVTEIVTYTVASCNHWHNTKPYSLSNLCSGLWFCTVRLQDPTWRPAHKRLMLPDNETNLSTETESLGLHCNTQFWLPHTVNTCTQSKMIRLCLWTVQYKTSHNLMKTLNRNSNINQSLNTLLDTINYSGRMIQPKYM